MAVRHVVLWDFDEKAPSQDVDRAFGELSALLSVIPGVQDFVSGRNVHRDWERTKPRYGITMIFQSMDDFRAYTRHENVEKALTAIRPYNVGAMQIQIEL